MQDSGGLGLRVEKIGETEGVMMTFRGKVTPAIEEDINFVRTALGLDLTTQEFRIAYGSIPSDNKELAILSRSLFEILVDLASNIEVPQEHVQDKRVAASMLPEVVGEMQVPPLIRIGSSQVRPTESFIAVSYRNYWYWIDDHDLRSKSLFTFLMFIFSLTETEGKEGAPVVTIPAG